MKAKDIKVGEEYVVCTQNPLAKSTWANKDRVRILEVPVPGWRRRYDYYGSSYPTKFIDTDPRARKDHALVQRIVRDYDAEREQRQAAYDKAMELVMAQAGWADLDEDERIAIGHQEMQNIKVAPIWKEGKEDRVRLRDIKMLWDEYARERDIRDKIQAQLKQQGDELDAALESISDRLPGDLRIERGRFYLDVGGHQRLTRPIVIQGYNGDSRELVRLLNKVLEETL